MTFKKIKNNAIGHRLYKQSTYFRIMLLEPLQISYSLADVAAAAHQLWQWAYPARIFAFSGSLGAGKTTFIHALCDALGVEDAVSSPTFALINEYRFSTSGSEQTIYHMDWYRLRDADEAIDAGMEDALAHPTAYCFVEWPEKAPELLHIPHIKVYLGSGSRDNQRVLQAEDSAFALHNRPAPVQQ